MPTERGRPRNSRERRARSRSRYRARGTCSAVASTARTRVEERELRGERASFFQCPGLPERAARRDRVRTLDAGRKSLPIGSANACPEESASLHQRVWSLPLHRFQLGGPGIGGVVEAAEHRLHGRHSGIGKARASSTNPPVNSGYRDSRRRVDSNGHPPGGEHGTRKTLGSVECPDRGCRGIAPHGRYRGGA
jgi:hypothetical protein